MLTDEVIEKVIERLVVRLQEANTSILEQIGESIKKIGTLSPSKAQQLVQILRYGGDFDKIIKKLAKVTELNVVEIYKIFNEVAQNDYNFAEQFYNYKNIKFIPYRENYALQNQVNALARLTAGEYTNLMNTKAIGFSIEDINGNKVFKTLEQAYIDILDTAVLNVGQGKDTFDNALQGLIKQFGESGLKRLDYESGRSIRLDSALRMQLKGALRNLHNETQKTFGEEFGADGVEISVHLNPAPDHEEVQGHQFSNKEFEKFQNDQDAVDYNGQLFPAEFEGHDRRSISEYNCYHYIFSIVLGVSKPEYSKKQLQQIIDDNNEGFELDGKHYTNYEGTQLQRQLESKIRQQKDIQIMARKSGNEQFARETQGKINEFSYKYNELSKISKLPTKLDRMRISGYRPIKAIYK